MAAAIKLHRHVGRRRAARFLAEGPNLVEAAMRRNLVIEVFVTEAALSRFGPILADVPVHVVTDRAAKALSDTVTPVGLVAVCDVPSTSLADVLADQPRLVAVAADISEPGNAGTLIRIADAMGADAVVLAGNSVDAYNPKTVRASVGSLFHLPFALEADPVRAVRAAQESGLVVLAADGDGELALGDAAGLLAGPVAWLFGNEAWGLPAELAAEADHRVRIPIRGRAESLNLATAAAICLHESSRTR